MFPHAKLDWNLTRLAREVEGTSADTEARLAFARAAISKARFHGDPAQWYSDALTQSRRVLHHEPGHPEAVLLAGLTLVLLDRAEAAERYLEEATHQLPDDARLQFAIGEKALLENDPVGARAAYEAMTHRSPDSWECHAVLGRLLARDALYAHATRREVEHAQYHLVRALQLGPSTQFRPGLLLDLARLCMRGGRDDDGARLLQLLATNPDHAAAARFHLGRIAARSGKHKKAILFFRQYLDLIGTEDAAAYVRIGASYLHLHEPTRAREACNRALAIDPAFLEARWVLGSALVAEGRGEDAIRVFRDLLEVAPDHEQAFAELVRMRTVEQDVRWLQQALRSETAVYDRLPLTSERRAGARSPTVLVDPRASTRARIDVLIKGLGQVDEDVTHTVLACLDLTTDEGLRFHLWEGVLQLLAQVRARSVSKALQDAGTNYSPELGRDLMILSDQLGGSELVPALAIGEDDLRAAAVARHGPADDVLAHRGQVDAERRSARAWQALVLLSLSTSDAPDVRALLVRWASDADDELATAAKASLAMMGDAQAAEHIRLLAAENMMGHLATTMLTASSRPSGPVPARLVQDRDDLICATCGRRGTQVSHLLLGHGVAICNVCTTAIYERRSELETRETEVACALTGATVLDGGGIYVYQGVAIGDACIEQSVGHEERETVASYLSSP